MKTVPYDDKPIGVAEKTWMRGCRLPNGSTVRVGFQPKHPHGKSGGYLHLLETTQPDGTRTLLRFCLTPEACVALVGLYAAHGIQSGPGIEILSKEELEAMRKNDQKAKTDVS